MPRNTDPDDIKVGSGTAGEESVTSSSLTVNISPSGSSGGGADEASEITSIAPDHLSGDDLQENLYSIDGTAPTPYPNLIGEAKSGVPNPSSINDWTYSEPLIDGLFYDGGDVNAKVINNTLLEIDDVIVYPADRGILAVRLVDGGTSTIIQALNLKYIFFEGEDPNDTAAPSRWVSQNDYTAGSSAVGDVDGLPQDISLSDRVPTLQSYGGPTYDTYPYDFYAYQIATAAFSINLSAGDQGELQIIHYRTEADYVADRDGTGTPETYSITSVSEGLPLFVDSDTATSVNITAFDIDPVDTADSAEVGPSRNFLSGILYYSQNDEYNLSFTVDGLYSNSYLNEGVELRMRGASDTASDLPFAFGTYSPGASTPGSTASFSNANYTIGHGFVTESDFDLRASDPFGRTDTQAWPDAGTKVLMNTDDYGTPPSATVETFRNEDARYTFIDIVTLSEVATDGTGSNFDPTAAITSGDRFLQVRGVVESHTLPEGIGGGELAWPDTNYSTGYFPSTKDGTNPQEDYSALSTSEVSRIYVRAFDLGAPKKQFQVRIVGEHLAASSSLWEDLQVPTLSGSAFSDSGIGMNLATLEEIQTTTLLSATTYLSEGGSLVEVEEESANSVLLTLQLNNSPDVNSSGEFPVLFLFAIETGSAAATAGEFALYKVEIL